MNCTLIYWTKVRPKGTVRKRADWDQEATTVGVQVF